MRPRADLKVRLLYRCDQAEAGDWFARMTPLGLGYINAALQAAGFDSSIGNFSGKTRNELSKWLARERPDLVGITVYTFNRFASFELARLAKQATGGRCTVVAGGPHATPLARSILEAHPEIDAVALGEGEVTAVELGDAVRGERGLGSVAGIVYRGPEGVLATLPRVPVEDLDRLPHPSRHYSAFGVDRAAQLQYVLSSRGCPAVCTFCDSPMFWGRAVRYRSPEDVVRELRFLRDEVGLVYVSFRDDTFTADKERSIEIARAIRESRLNLLWDCQSRVNCIDRERLAALRSAGCGHIQYGVESGSQRVLRLLAKGISVERVKAAIDDSRAVGVIPSIYLITGVPGETEEDVAETLRLIDTVKANDGIVSRLSVYPGTGVWDQYLAERGLDDSFWEKDRRASVWARDDRFGTRSQRRMVNRLVAVGRRHRFGPKDFAAHRALGGEAFATDLHEGWYYEDRGDWVRTAGVYQGLVAREPDNFWGYLRLGNVRRKQSSLQEALSLYRRVEALIPRYAGVQTVLGKTFLALGDRRSARHAFEAALSRDPDDPEARKGLGEAERGAGRKSRSSRPSLQGRRASDRTASFQPAEESR